MESSLVQRSWRQRLKANSLKAHATPGGPDPLTPLVKRMDVVGRGVFANNHSACLCAELLMNRYRHTVPIDFDQESLQFEIVAQCFV